MSSFLIEQSFTTGQVDKTLFIKKVNNDLLIVQIYVDDIIFGATNEILCKEFDAKANKAIFLGFHCIVRHIEYSIKEL